MTARIALISAMPLAIPPAAAALRDAFPDGDIWNLLDDRLLADAEREGGITEPLAARMDRLIDLALDGGADGVLLTCSQFGVRADARDRVAGGPAVLSADGPLFAEVVAARPERVLLVASLDSAAADSAERLGEALAAAGLDTTVRTVVVRAAVGAGDALADVLGDAIAGEGTDGEPIVLAQYSLAPAAAALAARFGAAVLDGPSAAARRLTADIESAGR